MLLLGMGLRSFSATPSAIPEIKRICRAVTIEQCRKVVQRTLQMETATNIKTYLRDELRRILPDAGH
jgi:phosphotransferase system enzyme I (PtsI)